MRARGRGARAALLVSAAALVAGCYRSSGAPDAEGDGALLDAGRADGRTLPFDGDAGMCEWLGSTRLCRDFCGLRCPEEVSWCTDFHFCVNAGPDHEPRGNERCAVDLAGFGTPHCYSGRVCVTLDRPDADGRSWGGGGCASDEYCRWMQTEPSLEGARCRYTDGFVFENGPPDHECAEGALPEDPFCGGRCGDRCPVNPTAALVGGTGSCVGRSETRGFGVCVQAAYRSRCWIGQEPTLDPSPFGACMGSLYSISGDTAWHTCVCMILSPVLMEEYADYGWTVAEQTCLAYQARYPDEVRCVPASEL